MIIKVDAGANAQNAHMDTEDKGSVSVHLPLQPLHKGVTAIMMEHVIDMMHLICSIAVIIQVHLYRLNRLFLYLEL